MLEKKHKNFVVTLKIIIKMCKEFRTWRFLVHVVPTSGANKSLVERRRIQSPRPVAKFDFMGAYWIRFGFLRQTASRG